MADGLDIIDIGTETSKVSFAKLLAISAQFTVLTSVLKGGRIFGQGLSPEQARRHTSRYFSLLYMSEAYYECGMGSVVSMQTLPLFWESRVTISEGDPDSRKQLKWDQAKHLKIACHEKTLNLEMLAAFHRKLSLETQGKYIKVDSLKGCYFFLN